jgi:hypothetical protein
VPVHGGTTITRSSIRCAQGAGNEPNMTTDAPRRPVRSVSARDLAGLGAEQLVQHVRSRVDVTSGSFYRRESSVAPVRIGAYPKRRRTSRAPRVPVVPAGPSYADFFVEPARRLVSA